MEHHMNRHRKILNLAIYLLMGTFACPSLFGSPVEGKTPTRAREKAASLTREGARVEVLSGAGDKAVDITVQSAVLMALDNNISFSLNKFEPQIQETAVQVARSKFENDFSAGTSWRNSDNNLTDNDVNTFVNVEKFYPSGTTVNVGLSNRNGSSDLATSLNNLTSIDLTVTRALLRGSGSIVNLASIKSAQIGLEISNFELEEAAQNLVAQVEKNYWNLRLAEERLKIYRESLEIANGQFEEAKERVRLGRLAGTELSAAEAEMASRQEDLINARSAVTKNRLMMLRLINMPGEGFWSRELALKDEIVLSDNVVDDVDVHVALALRDSPLLNQARLQIEQKTLEVVVTRNGVLPRLDAFIGYSNTSYSNSFYSRDNSDSDLQVGLVFETPMGKRKEKGLSKKAVLLEQQVREALLNLLQLTQQDLRIVYVEIERALQQVVATKATRKLREETSDAEKAKFRSGKSTSILVAQAERDLVIAKVAEVEARVAVKTALVDLYLLEGSLLSRKGITLQ
jgi:outer membrane protein TolC